MLWIPGAAINQVMEKYRKKSPQFCGKENGFNFELVEFEILTWNAGGNIMQAVGYGDVSLCLSASMKMIFNILEVWQNMDLILGAPTFQGQLEKKN